MKKTQLVMEAAGLAEALGAKLVEETKTDKPSKNTKETNMKKPTTATATVKKPAAKKPDAKKKAPPASPAVQIEKSEPNLLDSILAAGAAFAGHKVVEAISMANTILSNDGAVKTFVDVISAADALAVQKLGFDQLAGNVENDWYEKSFHQLKEQLQKWTSTGDNLAKKILATLAAFEASQADVTTALWQLVNEVVRPAKEVGSYADLNAFMKRLFDAGLVDKRTNQVHYSDKAVMIGSDRANTVYLPAMSHGKVIPMMESGWAFVKEAEKRAKDRVQEQIGTLQDLEHEATAEYWPSDAENGVEGKIFLQLSERHGALLLIKQIPFEKGTGKKKETVMCPRVQIIKTVGMRKMDSLIGYDAGKDAWPDGGLFFAFQAWKKRRQAE